ncbi:MAG: cation:proton antiporter, partial [Candidatus Omnitrophica bacterium]|nr:cation:proton antiporter [Candidatus Omnitrophota bacterium]
GVFEPIKSDAIILFLSELGVVILLFQIGLETSLHEMAKVGVSAAVVAVIGVITPFAIGMYVVGPWLMPGMSHNTYMFLGATMTATSVGITARVFKDLGTLQASSSKIVLGAAVIDDVLGLIILAVVSAIVVEGTVTAGSISVIALKAIGFLIGSILLGKFVSPHVNKTFSWIHTGTGMKFTLVIGTCLVFAFAAQLMGLAPIVGAFAAGLVLTPVHFRDFDEPQIVKEIDDVIGKVDNNTQAKVKGILERHANHHVEHLIEPIGHLLIPIFFVVTGINVKLETLMDPKILVIALGVSLAAIIGKLVSGLTVKKGDRLLVGWGMVPRGEVGLIFAVIGKSLGVVNDEVYSIIVIMVIITTLITPPVLSHLIKKAKTA